MFAKATLTEQACARANNVTSPRHQEEDKGLLGKGIKQVKRRVSDKSPMLYSCAALNINKKSSEGRSISG